MAFELIRLLKVFKLALNINYNVFLKKIIIIITENEI